MAALESTPKPVKAQTPRSGGTQLDMLGLHNSYLKSEDTHLYEAPGYTCHSTPCKKQNSKYDRYARSRNNSLPTNDKMNKRPSSYSYSWFDIFPSTFTFPLKVLCEKNVICQNKTG